MEGVSKKFQVGIL